MMIEKLMNDAKCCACEKPMKESGHINLVELHYKAAWKYPCFNNVMHPYPHNLAGSVVCDDCIEKKESVKFAVEFAGDEIIYHPLEELQIDESYEAVNN